MPQKPTKIIALFLCFCLIFEQIGFAQAASLNIAGYLSAISSLPTDKFRPLHLRSLSYDNQSNNFKLLIDKGDFFSREAGSRNAGKVEGGRSKVEGKTEKTASLRGALDHKSGDEAISNNKKLEIETKKLMGYFYIGLALPNDAFWVNLRPDIKGGRWKVEGGRKTAQNNSSAFDLRPSTSDMSDIINPDLAQTDIGRIMLETDVQLKKDTARMTSPGTSEGKLYWDKLYQKAEELFGTENITIPTLTRPWIVPNEIIIRETKDSAYIYKATLKVMLEEDYLKTDPRGVLNTPLGSVTGDPRLKILNEYSTQLIKEIIIPKLTKEVNSSKRYAELRQVYYSLILAQWFKARLKGLSPKGTVPVQINSRNLANLLSKEPWSPQTYFNEYQKSFKDGEYNIKLPIYAQFGQSIRSYFSGGEVFNLGRMPLMGEVAYNPETGTSISSMPAVSFPAVNYQEVIGLKVTPTDNLGESQITQDQPNSSSPISLSSAENTSQQLILGLLSLENKLNDQDRAVRLAAAQALGPLYQFLVEKGKMPLSFLETKLNDQNWAVRLAAAQALCPLYQIMIKEGKEVALSSLETKLNDHDPDVRLAVAQALCPLYQVMIKEGKEVVLSSLETKLNDQYPEVRLAVAQALGPLYQSLVEKGKMPLSSLETKLNDQNWAVRLAAAQALGPLYQSLVEKRKMPLSFLENKLNDQDPDVRLVAAQVLCLLCQSLIKEGKILDEDYNKYALWVESNFPYEEAIIKQYLASSDALGFISSLKQRAEDAINNGFDYANEEELWLAYLGIKTASINITYEEFKQRMARIAQFDRKHQGYFRKLFTKADRPIIIELSAEGARQIDASNIDLDAFSQNLAELQDIRQKIDSLSWMDEDFPLSKVFNLRNLYYLFKRQQA